MDHVEGGGPHDRSDLRIVDVRQVVDDRVPGLVVKPDPGKRVVVAVRDHQQARPVVQPEGICADVQHPLAVAYQPVAAEGVRADQRAVRPAALPLEHRDVAVAAYPQSVEAGGRQPHLRPRPDVAVGHLVQGVEEVAEIGIPEPVPGQVGVGPAQEGLLTEPGDQLPHNGVPLRIGDVVEVAERRVDVDHRLR